MACFFLPAVSAAAVQGLAALVLSRVSATAIRALGTMTGPGYDVARDAAQPESGGTTPESRGR